MAESERLHQRSRHSRRVAILALALLIGGVLAVYALAPRILPDAPVSSFYVGFCCLVILLFLVRRLVWELLPGVARLWIAKNIQFRDSFDTYGRLIAAAERRDSGAPDLSIFHVHVSRRDKVSGRVAALWATVLVIALFVPYGIFVILGGAALLAVALHLRNSSKWEQLRDHTVEIVDHELRQKNSTGKVVGRIDMARPFTYEYLDKATGFAIYQLRQDDQRLEFTSDVPMAKYLVRDLLRADWPPVDRLSM
jgi:hypothetical protein